MSPETSFMFQTFKQRVLSRFSLALGLDSQPERSWNIYLSEHRQSFPFSMNKGNFCLLLLRKPVLYSPNEIIFSQG